MAKFRSCSLSVQQRHQPTTRRLVCITIGGWLPPLHLSEDGPLPTSANNDAQRRTETWLAQCRRRSIFGKSYYPSTSPGDRTSPKFPGPPSVVILMGFSISANHLSNSNKAHPPARFVGCWMLEMCAHWLPTKMVKLPTRSFVRVWQSLVICLYTWRAVYLYSPKFFLFRQRSTARIHPIFFDGILRFFPRWEGNVI